MKTLDGMAHDLFSKFCLKETGKVGDWQYLSNERKLEWMKEVLVMAKYFLKELQTEIKPLTGRKQTQTVYEAGYEDGLRAERASTLTIVENKYNRLLDEFELFEYSFKK